MTKPKKAKFKGVLTEQSLRSAGWNRSIELILTITFIGATEEKELKEIIKSLNRLKKYLEKEKLVDVEVYKHKDD